MERRNYSGSPALMRLSAIFSLILASLNCAHRQIQIIHCVVARAQADEVPRRIDGAEPDSSSEHFDSLFRFSHVDQRVSQLGSVLSIIRRKSDGFFCQLDRPVMFSPESMHEPQESESIGVILL